MLGGKYPIIDLTTRLAGCERGAMEIETWINFARRAYFPPGRPSLRVAQQRSNLFPNLQILLASQLKK
jgi:hypothetical protein